MPDTFASVPGVHLKRVGDFATPAFVRRHPANPVLTGSRMPYPSHLVFNASVVQHGGRFVMMFRNEVYDRPGADTGKRAHLGLAYSDDGVAWTPDPQPHSLGLDHLGITGHAYDPRLCELEGRIWLTLCQDFGHGPQAVTLVTDDFRRYEVVSIAPPCSRNVTIFPERIGGKFWRLERPFWQAVDSYCNREAKWISKPYEIWVASSPDMAHWGDHRHILSSEQFDFANIKIGPGAPIRTTQGWLLLLHGVDHDPARGKNGWQASWRNRYHGGVALLDLADPGRVLAFNPRPFLTPEAPYEREGGWRNDVIFPMSGIVRDDGTLLIYYGAADTHTCIATCQLDELLAFCRAGG